MLVVVLRVVVKVVVVVVAVMMLVVVVVVASHQFSPGSNPGADAICGLSFLLVLLLAQRGFLRVLRFSPLLKNQHFQIPIRFGVHGHVSMSS